MEQEIFFVIELTNKDRSRGFVVEYPDGIHISEQPIADMARFDSYYSAGEFIKKHHLERKGVKASILSNQQLMSSMKDYKTISKAPMVYYIVINGLGHRVFFDTAQDGYYFKDGEIGSCVFQDEDSAINFIKQMAFPPDVIHKRVVHDLTTDQKN
jgi:hypothetical protein